MLLFALIDDFDVRIAHPTNEEVRYYQSAIGFKCPSISEVWVAAGGLKCTIECPEHGVEQNKFYNGWTHGHYDNLVFVFSPNGKICICLINAPGVFHDSAVSDYGVHEAMEVFFKIPAEKW